MKKGVLLALSGIDGSGKSTLTKGLFEKLESKSNKVLVTSVFEYFALKKLASWLGIKSKGTFTNTKNNNPFFTLIIPLILFDFWAHYIVRLNKLKSKYDYLICDRYFIDMLVVLSYLGYVPKSFFPLINALTPKADLQIILLLEPKTAKSRKPEHRLEYYQEEHSLYNRVKGKNVIRIDASTSKDKVLKQILKKIYEKNS